MIYIEIFCVNLFLNLTVCQYFVVSVDIYQWVENRDGRTPVNECCELRKVTWVSTII